MNEKKSYVAKFDFFAWKYVGTLQQKTLVIWYSPKLMKVKIKKSRGLNLLSEGIIQPSLVACSRKMEWDNQKNFLFIFVVYQLVKSLFYRWVSIRVSRSWERKEYWQKHVFWHNYWLTKSRRSVLTKNWILKKVTVQGVPSKIPNPNVYVYANIYPKYFTENFIIIEVISY